MDISYVKRSVDGRLNNALYRLSQKCVNLSRELGNVAEDIEKRGVNATVNGAGVVQSDARWIDSLCAEIALLKQLKEELACVDGEETK